MNLSDRIALGIYKNVFPGKRAPDKKILKDLMFISPAGDPGKEYRDFQIKRIKTVLAVITSGLILSVFMKISVLNETAVPGDGFEREEWDGKKQKIELYAYAGEEMIEVDLGLQTRKLTDAEAESLSVKFKEDLPELIRGANPDLMHVTENLFLMEKYDGFPFKVIWKSSDPALISAYKGYVDTEAGEGDLILTATYSYGDREWRAELPVHVAEKPLTERETLEKLISETLSEEESDKRVEKVFELPLRIGEQDIRWEYRREDNSGLVFGMFVLVAVVIFFASEKDLASKTDKKKEEMRKQYPKVLRQLALYVGAGMTVKAAFMRIAEEGKNSSGAVYQEMGYACMEMKQGVGEGECYERFGKRTGLSEYIKLSALLSQNLKRGNSNFIYRLRSEADAALKDQVLEAKKTGEEAQTKLLAPMMMELAVVMVMIMMPALTGINL